ncbi:hypothetical protein TgHK011_009968 [Trichoderma gracile]|nr:hypothetical protein TgHK011_009968 [Trichoderma gracile]
MQTVITPPDYILLPADRSHRHRHHGRTPVAVQYSPLIGPVRVQLRPVQQFVSLAVSSKPAVPTKAPKGPQTSPGRQLFPDQTPFERHDMLPSRIGRQSLRLAVSRPSSALPSSLTFSAARRPAAAGNRFCSSSSSSSSSNNNNSTSGAVSGAASTTNAKIPARLPGMPEHDHDVERYLRENHQRLFENNRKWAAERLKQDPEFFTRLSAGQSPEYLWIGCSDSRIPAEAITGLGAGEAFVHRNIANMVISTDLNVMSVINYAVRHLKVKHIVVCGHYGCGGVKAAMTPKDMGLLNPWLRNIRDVYRLHEKELDAIADEKKRYDRLVELNVFEQCRNVIKTADVQYSFEHNHYPIVHGWVFGFEDGLIKDLNIDMRKILGDIQKIYNLTDE